MHGFQYPHSKTDEDTNLVNEEEEEVEEEEDDDISSVARDLCSDMRESLNKLKQMETDDPNIQKILEVRSLNIKIHITENFVICTYF